MRFCGLFFCLWLTAAGVAQGTAADSGYRLELGMRPGQLTMEAVRFPIFEITAKPSGTEFRIRGEDQQDGIELLARLFEDRANAPMTNEKCRDAVLGQAANEGPLMQVHSESMVPAGGQALPPIEPAPGLPGTALQPVKPTPGLPGTGLAVATYSTSDARGVKFYVRAFAASGDLCGDVLFSSANAISPRTPVVREALATVRFDPEAKADFEGVFHYARLVFEDGMPDEAAPIYEKSIALAPEGENGKWRRVATDQAVTAYGIAGNWAKVRALLQQAIAADPAYALNYYNLACADAEAGKAADAKTHLEEAFDRRANTLPGEPLPDPTQDASLLKLRGDAAFWSFVEGLEKGRGDVF